MMSVLELALQSLVFIEKRRPLLLGSLAGGHILGDHGGHNRKESNIRLQGHVIGVGAISAQGANHFGLQGNRHANEGSMCFF